ncbi:GrpE, mitochondrial [Yamadazyma tenuis]|uniref:GrpE protein homolog, mitochondrial n=1 Tax=Candida tenuis (strain ATCC 10573 / BCRC 21748 / CBS 615 / JCM 9827 / NBRC 10315 / NRRL Y-1498 / VKM Y-70) TaxID=590646 RepID=G3AXW0_CANTC|nr:GrpE-domain-containing protein [Yamadazyma tenuis ATCC 10573]EGV65706.1 GrpE-domain-containing protein [Yamadazyma tenuis ATCC 10573]WEJ95976.1 GrpE, mitochondrial [Yamadazyma tenuis]
MQRIQKLVPLASRATATRAAVLTTSSTVSTALSYRPYYSPVFAARFNSTKAKNEPQEEKQPEAAAEVEAEVKAEVHEDPIVAELQSKLTTKDKQLADMKNHYARAVADFRNLQESTKKEVQKAKDFALQKFAKDLIVSLDNFSLALNAVKEDTLKTNDEVKNLYDGVQMTRTVFEKTLTNHGIEKIDPMGEPFDPNTHEAAFEIPQPDKEPGTVFHVQQPGYTLNSRVLRPAKVGIVKGE